MIVASVPAAHPYVASVVDSDVVTLLGDPVPQGAARPGQWWPPRLLEPDYLRRRLGDCDLLHVHFGFDTNSPDQLAEVVDVLDARGVPLAVTVHDLENPHFTDQAAHAARLDVLLPAAAALVTLTTGAAAEIQRRWGRVAHVLPHPHVLPLEAIGTARQQRARPVVAIHAKNLRANVDPWPLLDHLVENRRADWQVRLDLDEEVLGGPRADEACGQRLARYRRAGVDVRMHRRFSDQEMVDYLADIDVLVMPYRHGSHSGWIEACHDARVQAVVPDCGYFHEQHDNPVFGYGTSYFESESFLRAVALAVDSAEASAATVDAERRARRGEQRQRVRDATSALYRRVVQGPVDGAGRELNA